MSQKKTLLVIGGGAAGFFCAVNAARLHPGLEVILAEQSNKLLSKVKVSGGGRCNVTHACFDPVELSKRYPRGSRFVGKAFHQFHASHTVQWFLERGVTLKTEADGRMFPLNDSSQTIIDCLLNEAAKYNVQIRMKAAVKDIRKDPGTHKFHLAVEGSNDIIADAVCIATGGMAKGTIAAWLQSFGHTIAEPVPSLFTFNMPGHPITRLSGVSSEVQAKITGTKLAEAGPLLVTHWGLSGPAILKLSAWGARELAAMNYIFEVQVNWLPGKNEQQVAELVRNQRRESGGLQTGSKNKFGLPQRLWEFLVEQSGIEKTKRWADLSRDEQGALVKNLCACAFPVKGKTTFKEEFVTAGGVSLSEIDHRTMMSKKIPNLFFAGEVMDVDGVTGGFNFQHAWTSGFIAASSIS